MNKRRRHKAKRKRAWSRRLADINNARHTPSLDVLLALVECAALAQNPGKN
jgi:hypothetical protein